jgi:hypothetical protein
MRTDESSLEWVRRAAEYRVLLGKRDRLGYVLADDEQARIDELTRQFTHDANRRRLPWKHREQIRLPIDVEVDVAGGGGQARNISADGMFVATDLVLPVGARVVVRISEAPAEDDDGGVVATYRQWQFGAEVVRRDDAGLGLRFVGIPLALSIAYRRRESSSSDGDVSPNSSDSSANHAPA